MIKLSKIHQSTATRAKKPQGSHARRGETALWRTQRAIIALQIAHLHTTHPALTRPTWVVSRLYRLHTYMEATYGHLHRLGWPPERSMSFQIEEERVAT